MIDYDIAGAPEDAEVLLYIAKGDQKGVALARLHWFDRVERSGNVRVQRWQCTATGEELPADLKPFAFMVVPEADLGAV